jgi:ACS family hexuronate transporter-like MFS transporter
LVQVSREFFQPVIKVCGEWFPRRLRALAIGFFSSGSAIGALIAPPLIAWITLRYGWRMAFLVPGTIGLLWIPVWLFGLPPESRTGSLPRRGLSAFVVGSAARTTHLGADIATPDQRSCLVFVSILAARLFAARTWPQSERDRDVRMDSVLVC